MRTFLLFIGSLLYPVVMVVISPVLLTLYLLFGLVILSRVANAQWQKLYTYFGTLNLPLLHFEAKKNLVFRPKAVRLN